jgi:nicotinate-nucleotide adenylyltransferase
VSIARPVSNLTPLSPATRPTVIPTASLTASAVDGPGRRRIGLFGGSFDPVHQAHAALAHAALDQLGLDELRWMPAGQPWQKARPLTPAAHRAAMLQLLIAAEPRWRLERCEIERAGPSYTLDSLVALQTGAVAVQTQADRADWFLLIGQDQYANFTRWHGWQQILQRATLAVAARAGTPVQAPPELAQWLDEAISSGGCAPQRRPLTVELPAHEHAATTVRDHLAAGQDPATLAPQWLAPEVAGYIARHRLYAHRPHPTIPPARS